jgi:type IV pilus assembly protein PilE
VGLAMPPLRGHVVKVRQAEARVALLQASHFMAQWRSQHGRYTQGSGIGRCCR